MRSTVCYYCHIKAKLYTTQGPERTERCSPSSRTYLQTFVLATAVKRIGCQDILLCINYSRLAKQIVSSYLFDGRCMKRRPPRPLDNAHRDNSQSKMKFILRQVQAKPGLVKLTYGLTLQRWRFNALQTPRTTLESACPFFMLSENEQVC